MQHKRCLTILLALAVACFVTSPAVAGVSPFLLTNGNIGITIDENCHWTLNGFGGSIAMPCTFAPDPGPGGLPSVMTYDMLNPPGLVVGDVLMVERAVGDPCQGCILDVIRFNPDGTLLFYSDNLDGFDSGGDTFGPPGSFYPNVVSIDEVGTEQFNYGHYIPLPGQPGFVAGAAAPVEYLFISDTPEPGTLLMLGTGIIGALGVIRPKMNL